MKLIVGLGNPGLRYKNTRHNAGFIILEYFAKKHRLNIKKRMFNALTVEGRINGEKIFLLLPQTFMNLSGESVVQAAGKVESLSDMLIVYDDIDLPLGAVRFRAKGSSGGHNGVSSIIESLDTSEFPRLRIGIKPDFNTGNTADFVLRPFLTDEKVILKDVIFKAIEGIEAWISDGIDKCMTRYN